MRHWEADLASYQHISAHTPLTYISNILVGAHSNQSEPVSKCVFQFFVCLKLIQMWGFLLWFSVSSLAVGSSHLAQYLLNGGHLKVKWNQSFQIKLISSKVELHYLFEQPKEAIEYRSHLCDIFVVSKMFLWNSLQWVHLAPFCHLSLAVQEKYSALGSGLI